MRSDGAKTRAVKAKIAAALIGTWETSAEIANRAGVHRTSVARYAPGLADRKGSGKLTRYRRAKATAGHEANLREKNRVAERRQGRGDRLYMVTMASDEHGFDQRVCETAAKALEQFETWSPEGHVEIWRRVPTRVTVVIEEDGDK